MDNCEGLNCVPTLLKSAIKKNKIRRKRRSQVAFHRGSNYNGNYEGDTSMFQCRCHYLVTDSETEANGGWKKFHCVETPPDPDSDSERPWKEFEFWMVPKRYVEKLTAYAGEVRDNAAYQWMSSVMRGGFWAVVFLLRMLLMIMAYMSHMTYVLWQGKSILRQGARNLLWKLTLAKCDDVAFFAVIVLVTPLIFAIAFVGLILSVYCAFKEFLNRP